MVQLNFNEAKLEQVASEMHRYWTRSIGVGQNEYQRYRRMMPK
jgi:hypothetical protein